MNLQGGRKIEKRREMKGRCMWVGGEGRNEGAEGRGREGMEEVGEEKMWSG